MVFTKFGFGCLLQKKKNAVQSNVVNRNYNKNRLVARILTGGHTHTTQQRIINARHKCRYNHFSIQISASFLFCGCHSSRLLHILLQYHICIWQLPNTNSQQQLSCTKQKNETNKNCHQRNQPAKQKKTSTKRNEKKKWNRRLKSNLKQQQSSRKLNVGDTFFSSFFPSNANKTNEIRAFERND